MSETTGQEAGAGAAPAELPVEDRARIMGWRPKEEFKGNPEKWVPAEDFLKNGFETPAVLADRYRALESRFGDLARHTRNVETKLDEAVGMVAHVTKMASSAEERAYRRAKAELEAKRDSAASTGDVDGVRAASREIEALEKPVDPPTRETRREPAVGTGAPAGGYDPRADPNNAANNPAVQAFHQEHGWWYGTDAVMRGLADAAFTREMNAGRSLEQALQAVATETRQRFPERFRSTTQPATQPNGAGNGAVARQEQDDDEDAGGSPTVTPSSGRPHRQQAQKNTFDAMPRDSKAAYERYAKMLDGKGPALTKEEWAREYWAQFEEV